jgi:hypothetical protein
MAPLNIGFFAVKPSQALMKAALAFSEAADYNNEDGWDNASFLPAQSKYPGAECGQGFFHTLLYKKSPLAEKALRNNKVQLAAHQIDKCVWNYQVGCPKKDWDCSTIRAHHKGGAKAEQFDSCVKYGERTSRFHLSSSSKSHFMNYVRAFNDDGVWFQEGPVSLELRPKILPTKGNYGFYLHTFGQAFANVHLLRDVRHTYPEAPVYIMSDGGMDFSGICEEIGNCKFQWKPPANDRWNPVPFFNRFREAARWLQTTHIVMLEPDNTLLGKMPEDPGLNADAGGLNDWSNSHFHKELIDYLEKKASIASGNPNY